MLFAGWSEDLPGSGPIRKWLFYHNFGGILTVIQHNGWISAIAHQSTNDAVYAGMQVKEGQLIGKSGNTKTRTSYVAAHVHIEALVYMDYRTDVSKGIIYGRVNPAPYFGTIASQGTITKQEDEELSDTQVERIINEVNTANEAKHKATRSAIADAVKSINFSTQQQVEAVGRVTQQLIVDNATPAEIADSIPQEIAQEIVTLLVERLKN